MNKDVGQFILTLLHAATNTHILHLRSKTLSEHAALGAFYEKLPDLVDGLVENIQGLTEELIEYPVDYYPPMVESLDELRSLRDFVREERVVLPQESEIKNDVDEIAKLINKTIYKLKFLK